MGKSGCSHGSVVEEAYQQQTNPEREEEHVYFRVCVCEPPGCKPSGTSRFSNPGRPRACTAHLTRELPPLVIFF